MDILSQSTIIDELIRLLLGAKNLRMVLYLCNTNRIISHFRPKIVVKIVKMSYPSPVLSWARRREDSLVVDFWGINSENLERSPSIFSL